MRYVFHFDIQKFVLCVLSDDTDACKTRKLTAVSNLDINVKYCYDRILKLSFQC